MRYKEGFYKLKEVSNITMGQSPKSEFYNEEKIGTPFLQGNTTFGAKYPGIEKYTTKETRISNRNEVLMSVRAPVGDININPYERICIGRGLCSISLKNNKNQYLYYFLKANEAIIRSKGTGTVFASINKSDVENIKIFLPDEDEISSYVAPLKALDDKIENNNAIIANLEAQAQAIFKSWFIDFEPFQEGAFVDSELGEIPECWEVGKLGDSSLGKLLKSGINNFEDEKIYLATADVNDSKIMNYDTKVTFQDRPSRANMQPTKNSVWFAKMKESRKLIHVGNNDDFLIDEVIFSTGFAGIQATELSVNFIWTYLLSEDFNTKKDLLSNGTTMQAINNTNINKIKIVIPKEQELKGFNDLVRPMFELISNYKYQNIKLTQIRDILLPKLMSGEIRVGQDNLEEIETEI